MAVALCGLRFACDCFAVPLGTFFFRLLYRPIRCARPMSLLSICLLVGSKFAVAPVALPIESLPPRFFLGWPKHSSENHGKSDFWRQNFDERDRRICNEKAVLANDVIVGNCVSNIVLQ